MTDIGLIALNVILIIGFIYILDMREKSVEFERQHWQAERQQLLDRIQAPSFDHLKQAEIRLVKAQKEEPAVKYELV